MGHGCESKRREAGEGHEETREHEGRDLAHVIHPPDERWTHGTTQRTDRLRRTEDRSLLVRVGVDGHQPCGCGRKETVRNGEHEGPCVQQRRTWQQWYD